MAGLRLRRSSSLNLTANCAVLLVASDKPRIEDLLARLSGRLDRRTLIRTDGEYDRPWPTLDFMWKG